MNLHVFKHYDCMTLFLSACNSLIKKQRQRILSCHLCLTFTVNTSIVWWFCALQHLTGAAAFTSCDIKHGHRDWTDSNLLIWYSSWAFLFPPSGGIGSTIHISYAKQVWTITPEEWSVTTTTIHQMCAGFNSNRYIDGQYRFRSMPRPFNFLDIYRVQCSHHKFMRLIYGTFQHLFSCFDCLGSFINLFALS